ncbi:MAG: alpha/beta fold hydrolase [Rubrobacteraceae bacterium]
MRLKSMLAAGGVLVGLAVLNKRLMRSGGELTNALGGETRYHRWNGYDLAYTVAGEGEPLLMVHGVYAGASSFEFRKNFDELSKSFRVYALDLLGCGLSERPRRGYGPEDVTSQIEDFAREEIGTPTHLIASSLTAALSMPAAVRNPKLFKKLVFNAPTGYSTLGEKSGLLGDFIYGLFRTPVLGDSLYHLIVSRRGIGFYLGRMSYHDSKFVTEELVENCYRISHQPGAKYLPAAFASGKLNQGVADYWPRIPHKTLVCWSKEATTSPAYEIEDFVQRNPRSEPRIFKDASLLPHDERAETFNEQVKQFLQASSKG